MGNKRTCKKAALVNPMLTPGVSQEIEWPLLEKCEPQNVGVTFAGMYVPCILLWRPIAFDTATVHSVYIFREDFNSGFPENIQLERNAVSALILTNVWHPESCLLALSVVWWEGRGKDFPEWACVDTYYLCTWNLTQMLHPYFLMVSIWYLFVVFPEDKSTVILWSMGVLILISWQQEHLSFKTSNRVLVVLSFC